MAETRDDPPRPLLSRLFRTGGAPTEFGRWIRTNWAAMAILVFIFVIALFVRSYFAYDMSAENDFIVSGGSDSYYWMRIIDYHVETGDSLYWDPLINFPEGLRNPRPPFYSMSVALPALVAADLFSSIDDAVGFMLVWSTAFWGALTVIPVYFLGKETFGRRAGLIAAFLLALMPSHVQRSVLSNADHDAFILFFIVLTFYFLLKAVKVQEHIRWVADWKSLSSIRSGLRAYFEGSRTAILYALLAGTAFACVIMAWVGFAYVAVLILAYLLIQTLFNRFKDIDSMSVLILVAVAMGFGYLISFPVYFEQSLVSVRFDVPVYLFLAAVVFAGLFVVSRDYPWTMTFPAIGMIVAVGVLGISVVNPALGEAIMSGQGYFVQSKLYSTIAEARAPAFSELAMSFGMVTFFVSLIGLFYAMLKIPKQTTAEYIFIVVWLGAAIFMAISAGRFMFNAAPAFALASGWILVLMVDKLDFAGVAKSLRGASGSLRQIFRKSIKIRHVVGALFLAFFIVMPNVWFSVDAAIPSESKSDYDLQIYESMPSFMRPSDYDEINGSLQGGGLWYLGSFGYSLPLPSQYYPAAWDWFAEQDQEILPETSRPAYVAWWDYGFEAVQEGDHPTVADNFQNGYELAGNVIMAQSEEDAVALFAYRLIQCSYERIEGATEALVALFERYGVSAERMHEILRGPGQAIIDEILADPDRYGPMASDMSHINARIVAGRTELADLGSEALTSFYDELCGLLGWEIRYFNVDSRMFPISAMNTGIFYAPAKLSDRRIADGSIPIDFFEILAVTDTGNQVPLDSVTPSMTVVNYAINYSSMFYDSMFYRAMAGFSGSDIGVADGGLPGYGSGNLQSFPSMPGWNMTHFRVVYRTAYYNPYPAELVPFHSDAWRAVSYDEAQELRARITAGEIEGVIDESASSLYRSGTVFLKYYHGAYVNGTVATEEGLPVSGVRVTVQDEYGIPHDTVLTDSEGRYSLLAPFGEVTLVVSTGPIDVRLEGSEQIASVQFVVTDAQAMRERQDLDLDGVYDYIITKDFAIEGGELTGDVYWDMDEDGNFTASADTPVAEAVVHVEDLESDRSYSADVSDGRYDKYLPPGRYRAYAELHGTELIMSLEFNVTSGEETVLDLSIKPASASGYALARDGSPMAGLAITLENAFYDYALTTTTDEDGFYSFSPVVRGKYILSSEDPDLIIFDEFLGLDGGYDTERNVTVAERTTAKFRITLDGRGVPYAAYSIVNPYYPIEMISGTADRFGLVEVDLPAGRWSLYSVHSSGEGDYAGYRSIDTFVSDRVTGTVALEPALKLKASPRSPSGMITKQTYVQLVAEDGTRLVAQTNTLGDFEIRLPKGVYEVVCWDVSGRNVYSGVVDLQEDIDGRRLPMEKALFIAGEIWADIDSSGSAAPSEVGRQMLIEVVDAYGRVYATRSSSTGNYRAMVVEGTRLQLSLAEPGYEDWSYSALFGNDVTDITITASPDDVLVTGQVTSGGSGVRNVQVSFLPYDIAMGAVHVTTGTGGYYTALLPPSDYRVVVDHETGPAGATVLQYESSETFLPSGRPITYDIVPVERVLVRGNVFGAASEVEVVMTGPETPSVSVSLYSYTAYAMPGTYDISASGTTDDDLYVTMTRAEVSAESHEFDLVLELAYELSGAAYIGSSRVSKPVEVTVTSTDGAEVAKTSTAYGSFDFSLADGEYGLSCVYETTTVEGGRTLYVEYVSSQVVTVQRSDIVVNPVLSPRLDNTTVAGVVTGPGGDPVQAKISLTPNTKYGLGAVFYTDASGAYSADVQPGDYTVYVERLQDGSVHLGHLGLSRNVAGTYDVTLSEGVYLSGRLTAGGVGTEMSVEVSSGDASLTVSSDSAGYFAVLLPTGTYELYAGTEREEAGLTVEYSVSESVEVGAHDTYAKLSLDRRNVRAVKAYWNESVALPAGPGETVSYSFTVENTGNIGDDFECRYIGTGFSVTFAPEEQFIDFGTNGNRATFVAEITVLDAAKAGNTSVPIQVRSRTSSVAQTTLDLMVKVQPVYNTSVTITDKLDPVSSRKTTTGVSVVNNGNIAEDFAVEIANTEYLRGRGWDVRLISATEREPIANFTLEVGASEHMYVEFTAIRSEPDPTVEATVIVSSRSDPGSATLESVPVRLPDLSIGPGDLEVVRDDVSYDYDPTSLYMNIGLGCTIAALAVVFLILRKQRGLGKKRGEKR